MEASRSMNRLFLSIPLLLTLSTSCAGKGPGAAARPKEMTAAEAGLADPVQCSASDDDKTLIVDLDATDRKSIEEMITSKKVVPVVGYDCKTLKILPTCKLDAEFTYIGSSSRERVIEIESSDSVAADIPLASASLKASVKAGRKVDIALAEVGSKSSALELVAKPQLVPLRKGDCEGATHFVYKVDVGAFAIAQKTSGEASAAVEVFGKGASGDSKDAKKSSTSEGKLDACRKASNDDKASPNDCGVPLRLYLRRILATNDEKAEAEKAAQAKSEDHPESAFSPKTEPPCPKDLVRAEGGSCVKPSPSIRYLCRPDNVDECRTQCGKGHLGSCERLGRSLLWGPSRDIAGAIEALEKSCTAEKTEPRGCASLADAYQSSVKPGDKGGEAMRGKAESALKHGCEHSDAPSCAAWGRFYEYGSNLLGVAADPERGVRYYARACGLGDQYSCVRAASLYVEGSKKQDGTEIFKKSPKQGLDLLDTACRQGAMRACEQLGIYLTNDKYKVKDVKRAADLFDELCKKNNKVACAEFALLQVSGQGTKADPAAARKILEDLCYDEKVTAACYGVGLLADTGMGGVAENKPKAVEYFTKSSYVKDASLRLAKLLESGGKGVTADLPKAAKYYGTACMRAEETDGAVCRKAGDITEKTKTSPTWVAAMLLQESVRHGRVGQGLVRQGEGPREAVRACTCCASPTDAIEGNAHGSRAATGEGDASCESNGNGAASVEAHTSSSARAASRQDLARRKDEAGYPLISDARVRTRDRRRLSARSRETRPTT
jgi:uncharacterized protein